MTWKANATEDMALGYIVVRLAERMDDGLHVAGTTDSGDVVMSWQSAGYEVPPFLRLPYEAAEALRDALNGHMPPRDDRDLRDALKVERERVDRVLGRIALSESV